MNDLDAHKQKLPKNDRQFSRKCANFRLSENEGKGSFRYGKGVLSVWERGPFKGPHVAFFSLIGKGSRAMGKGSRAPL